jgi:RNase H-like domain found in reverse transcriptase
VSKDLYARLKGNKTFKWEENEEKAFVAVKNALRSAKNLKLPEYDKEFVLKTDASNTGLGAVLLQKDREEKLVPIQWASKKLTPTEERYAITEKEMLAVKWGIEKFSYELRGRRFHLITDHRALEHIRNKPEFENQRINRWIESIQGYDFRV